MSGPFICVSGLVKTYKWGRVKAVDGVSLEIRKGEMFGLIGPNGAGKTTLMGCMLGLMRPSKGSVTVDGMTPNDIEVKAKTGFLPERPDFSRWMTVYQFLDYHHMLSLRDRTGAKADIQEMLDLVGLEQAVAKRPVKELSRGMLQRLGLAQALIGKPEICYLDEPTSGMDPLGMTRVREILLESRKSGVTIVLNSHHLDEVEKTCDRVAFIRKGSIEAVRDLSAGSTGGKWLRVHWNASERSDTKEASLLVAQQLEIDLVASGDGFAEFNTSDRLLTAEVIRRLVEENIAVNEATIVGASLEELFIAGSEDKPGGAST